MENLPDRVTAGTYRHWALSPVNWSASYGQNLTCDGLSAVFLADLSASSLAEEVFRRTAYHPSLCFFSPFSFNINSVRRSDADCYKSR
jgi:hypothetical protein